MNTAVQTITEQAARLTPPQIARMAREWTVSMPARQAAFRAADDIRADIEAATWDALANAMDQVGHLHSSDDEVTAVWNTVRNVVLGVLAAPYLEAQPSVVGELVGPWEASVGVD